MATKNLARTPLEAGNTPAFQRERREDRRWVRRESRAFCHRVRRDMEVWEADVPPLSSEVKCRSYPDQKHDDKLSAVNAWVAAQAGRRWDDVYSEIRRRFDTRTLAGWHIVDAHLPSDADFVACGYRDGTFWVGGGRVYVDGDGVLRLQPHERPPWKVRNAERGVPSAEFDAWLAGRKILRRSAPRALYGVRYYWGIHQNHIRVRGRVEVVVKDRQLFWWDRTRIAKAKEIPIADVPTTERVEIVTRYARYRQDRELTWEEFTFFHRTLSKDQRKHAMDLRVP